MPKKETVPYAEKGINAEIKEAEKASESDGANTGDTEEKTEEGVKCCGCFPGGESQECEPESIVAGVGFLHGGPTINIEGSVYLGYSPEEIIKIMKGLYDLDK